ncbi:MAG: allantoinase, partial [Rubrobacteraceae bacterium]
MSTYDLIVRGSAIVLPGGPQDSDIGISGGKITAVEPELEGTASEEVTASGLHIFPGAIDAHAHFNEPGRTHWEGFATGSRSQA